jgi:octaprenyl-diphosphate synthase
MDLSPAHRVLNDLYKSIQPDLDRVEIVLRDVSRDPNPLIAEINSYLFQVAGKRVRPALLLLSGRLFGKPSEDAPFWSAMIEVIHTASLIHDDIVDNSERRRGRETVHAKWGPNITVLLGDFLYIKSIVLSLKKRHYRLIDILADVTAEMIEGELIESSWSRKPEIPEAVYLDILDKKTASLFAGACRIGGVLGGASPEAEDKLERFGRSLGLCFQIVDDWLDYSGDAAFLGKPVLSDVREGRMTLPLLLALNRSDKDGRRTLVDLIRKCGAKGRGIPRILDIVRRKDALQDTLRRAQAYAAEAKAALEGLPASEDRDALLTLTDLLLQRKT